MYDFTYSESSLYVAYGSNAFFDNSSTICGVENLPVIEYKI